MNMEKCVLNKCISLREICVHMDVWKLLFLLLVWVFLICFYDLVILRSERSN